MSESSLVRRSSEKKRINIQKANFDTKSVKAYEPNANYESEDFSEKNRKACVQFIKKYNYLIVNEDFAIEPDSLQGKYKS